MSARVDRPRPAPGAASVRAGYVDHGVHGYYAQHGASYRNPHEPLIAAAIRLAHDREPLPLGRVLDLACGSGEATLALRALGAEEVVGIDPYTAAAYRDRTGQTAIEVDFAAIAGGALDGSGRFEMVVCSFALHLAEPSRLPALTWALAGLADELLVLSPHKRPPVEVGFVEVQAFVHQRVRVRRFLSTR